MSESSMRSAVAAGFLPWCKKPLSQLRLDIKYLMFDLDMTRKERDELRERLGG